MLPDARPCTKVPGCNQLISFMPSVRGRPVCLEAMPATQVEPNVAYYYVIDGLARRTTEPGAFDAPVFVCHTSRPGHQHLGKAQVGDIQEYYASERWTRRRDAYLRRVPMCEAECGRRAETVHHVRYDNLGREPDEDLLALCHPCHAREHV